MSSTDRRTILIVIASVIISYNAWSTSVNTGVLNVELNALRVEVFADEICAVNQTIAVRTIVHNDYPYDIRVNMPESLNYTYYSETEEYRTTASVDIDWSEDELVLPAESWRDLFIIRLHSETLGRFMVNISSLPGVVVVVYPQNEILYQRMMQQIERYGLVDAHAQIEYTDNESAVGRIYLDVDNVTYLFDEVTFQRRGQTWHSVKYHREPCPSPCRNLSIVDISFRESESNHIPYLTCIHPIVYNPCSKTGLVMNVQVMLSYDNHSYQIKYGTTRIFSIENGIIPPFETRLIHENISIPGWIKDDSDERHGLPLTELEDKEVSIEITLLDPYRSIIGKGTFNHTF